MYNCTVKLSSVTEVLKCPTVLVVVQKCNPHPLFSVLTLLTTISDNQNNSQAHKMIHAGRDLRTSLVLPTPQSRMSCEIVPGCSGLFSVGSGKPSRLETAKPLQATLTVLMMKKCFPGI